MKGLFLMAAITMVTATHAADSVAQTLDRRAQLKEELAQMEQAGYDPAGNQIDYPANVQAAREKIVSARLEKNQDSEQTASK
ncbi:DUF4148 domain-containing protein [Paraburkholderia caribensis]|uniref:DUF4148 domain-containing protein n=1 Tax=Paraburkholderia caribensis TaxID=75105 RepID=UPI001CAD47AD|nr:DUF4148 domain-containing protein [Paraburkholderia caribensis]CAG9243793.1 exported hypothetical protein [Paraburkholderia caribensis]